MGEIPIIPEKGGGPGFGDFVPADPSGDFFRNGTRIRIWFSLRDGGAPCTVTVLGTYISNFGFFNHLEIVLKQGTIYQSLLFESRRFGSYPNVTYSDATDVMVVGIEGGDYRP